MSTPDLSTTYGAMLVGLLFATFFQGLLTSQAYTYYEYFPEDPWTTKSLVAGAWLLDALHLVFIAKATYYYLVDNWGNPPALLLSTWEFDIHLIPLGLAAVLCQFFFIRRIWVFSKNRILTIALACVCLSTVALDIYLSVTILRDRRVEHFRDMKVETAALFSISVGVDVIIALLMTYYLQQRRSNLVTTQSLVPRLIQYTVATGLATSLLALASLISYLLAPDEFTFIAIHFSVGRMYTNSLLASLNARRSLREEVRQATVIVSPHGKRQSPFVSTNSEVVALSNRYGRELYPSHSGDLSFPRSQAITAEAIRAPEDSVGRAGALGYRDEVYSIRDKAGLIA